MKNLLRFLTVALVFAAWKNQVVAQTYNMSSGTVNTCSGTFYDPGGAGGNYGNNANFTQTFCSNNGQPIYLTFTSFSLENNWDFMYIYNGPNTGSPLIGTYTSTNSPGTVVASGTCITIRFTSDGSVTNPGWAATIGCGTPPPPPPAPGGSACGSATPFCTGTTYNFPAGVNNGSAPAGPAYGCLGSTPNPVWYYLQVANSGNIDLTIQSTPSYDIDFIAWGPFTSPYGPCLSGLTAGTIVDCSYSTAATEYINIPNAVTGQYYMVLITNFSNQPNNISFSQTGGAGSTNCNILCNITAMTATPGACAGGSNTYSVNGNLTVFAPPTSGTLTISSSCGGTPTVINPPFSTSIPYTVSNIPANGAACSITASFSADPLCVFTTNYTAPASCGCSVSASNGGNVCQGSTITLSATAVAGATSYAWTGPNGFTASGQNVSVPSAGAAATGTYTVTVTTGGGATCTSTTAVTVYPPPTAAPTAVAATCGQSNGSITSNVSGGQAPYSFSWTPSGTGANPTGMAPGTYTLTVTDNRGCTSTATVVVGNTGSVTSTFAAVTNQCLTGNSYTFTNTGSAGAGINHTYTFNPTGGAPASGSTANYGPVSFTTAGTYTVTHTVTQGSCNSTTTQVINIFPNPNVPTFAPVNATCGNNNGSVTSVATGGTPGYSYSWAPSGGTGANASGLAPGNYTLTVTDANGCPRTGTTSIGTSPGPTAIASTPTSTTCGANNGQINITGVTGGTPAYTYSVDGGPYTATTNYINLSSGNHTVSVTDANGCIYTTNVNVPNAGGPTGFTGTPTQTACTSNTGSITVTGVTGGVPGYTYSFNNGVTFGASNTATGLAAGTYTVVVMDNNSCTFSQQVIVTTVPGPTDITFTNINASCGLANGTVNASGVTGGLAPYQYSLNGGANQAGSSFPNLSAATYTVQVTDANGCTYQETTTLTNAGSPSASITTQTNVLCNGGTNGSVTIGVTGGTPTYNYTITPVATNSGSGTFTNMSAGNYTITVTDNAGCQTTQAVTITQPTTLTASITAQTNVSCAGGNNGSVTVSGANATPAYQYSLNGGASQASGTFTALAAGTYTVTVRDANNCTVNQTVTITAPPVLTLNPSSTNANCTASNGTASVIASGGTPSYTYSWAPVGGTAATTIGVAGGITYTVTVTDANGCVQTATSAVAITPGGTATMSTIGNATCNGVSNGTLTVSMSGNATAPFSYAWSPNVGTTATVTGLAPTSYTVTVTDAFGCIATANANLSQPTALSVSFTSNNVSCNGGSDGTITATPSGGTAPYAYSWSPGSFTTASISGLLVGTYTVTVTDANGCTTTGTRSIVAPTALSINPTVVNSNCNQANGSISVTGASGAGGYSFSLNGGAFGAGPFNALTAGTYTITVRDANLCSASFPVTIVDQAGPVANITAQTNVSCNGGNNGSATVAVSGGTGPYTYLWNPGGQASPTATNLTQGIYGVNVTDANGCVATAGVTITQPTAMTTNASSTNPTCNGYTNGTASVSAFGGATPYAYSWSTTPIQTTSNATGLAAGNYNVIITDANGCSVTQSVSLVNPPAVTAVINGTNLVCNGFCTGVAQANVSNAVLPVTYSWNDPNAQTTQSATGLCAGTYTVNITDANGCLASASVNITQPLALTTNITNQVNINCFGNCNGSAQVNTGGGTPPYSISWTGGQTSAVATNLCAGTYTATVSDANGCSSQSNVNITQPANLTISATKTDATCFGLCNGTATANFSGGTAPYNFVWQPSLNTTFNPGGLCAGTHTVTITDVNGCNQNTTVTITEPPQLSTSTTVVGNNFCGQATGSALVNVSGGIAPFTYAWSNGVTSAFNPNLLGGSYVIVVTDANGCTTNNVANIVDIPGPQVTLVSSTNITCFGANNGTAVTNITGGTPAYVTTWLLPNMNPNPVQNGTSLVPGINTFQVADAAGCVSSVSVNITEPSQVVTLINGIVDQSCNPANGGACNGSATILVNGGSGPYTFGWNDPLAQTSATAFNLCAGTYTCVVTDANGCTSQQTASINVPPPLVIVNNSIQDVTCYGNNNGQISVLPTGGTPAYNYFWTPGAATGPVVSNLPPGTYQLTVTDSKGCVEISGYNITQPDSFTVVMNANSSTCSGTNGMASAAVSGATPNYTYAWNSNPVQTGAVATGLGAGAYQVSITDINGCTTTGSINVFDLPPPTIDSTTVIDVDCFGFTSGSATVYPKTGGDPNLTFNWSNLSGSTVSTVQTATGLPAGTYNIIVADGHGCSANAIVTIVQPNQLTISASQNMTACNGEVLGVFATAGGGTQPYTYTWSGAGSGLAGGGNQNLTFSNTGNNPLILSYSVSVTDSFNCPAQAAQFDVTVRPRILPIPGDTNGCEGSTVNPSVSATGGDGSPYTFTWSTGVVSTGSSSSITSTITSPLSITYTVSVDDGCSLIEDTIVTVTVNPKPVANLLGINVQGCSDLTVTFAGTAGGSGFANSTYLWSFGDGQTGTDSTTSHTYTNSGTTIDSMDVQLIVSSAQGCKDTMIANNYVIVYPKPIAEFSVSPTITEETNPIFSFINQSQGGTQFNWNFGEPSSTTNISTVISPTHAYENAGTYDVWLVATSTQGCIDSIMHPVTVQPEFALYVPNAFTPNEDLINEVFIPKGIGIDEDRYQLYIYNRWGEMIFESNNFNTGWNGTAKGNTTIVQEDVYIWKIIVYDKKNNKHNLVGHVTVVK